jgi:hypothetical protein
LNVPGEGQGLWFGWMSRLAVTEGVLRRQFRLGLGPQGTSLPLPLPLPFPIHFSLLHLHLLPLRHGIWLMLSGLERLSLLS